VWGEIPVPDDWLFHEHSGWRVIDGWASVPLLEIQTGAPRGPGALETEYAWRIREKSAPWAVEIRLSVSQSGMAAKELGTGAALRIGLALQELRPLETELLYHMCRAFLALGERDQASQYFTRLQQAGPEGLRARQIEALLDKT